MDSLDPQIATKKNVLGQPFEPCSFEPLTGFYRDGCCNTGPNDLGVHTVCCIVTEEFLATSARLGNDLSTPMPQYGFPGLHPGDQWCVCAARWLQVVKAGCPLPGRPRIHPRGHPRNHPLRDPPPVRSHPQDPPLARTVRQRSVVSTHQRAVISTHQRSVASTHQKSVISTKGGFIAVAERPASRHLLQETIPPPAIFPSTFIFINPWFDTPRLIGEL